jgi:mannose-6-phosphate isomerase-like protein (cupin superfamily)
MAAQLKQATVTRIIQDVQLLPSQASPKPAHVNDIVRQNTAVRTGADSRTELTFTDRTLTRLGANTLFTFNEGTRSIDLGGGAMLLSVPKGAATTRILTAGVTAGISGGTALAEYHRHAYSKFIVLEGVARIYLRHRLGESLLLHAGQMIILKPNAKHLPDPVDIDLGRLMKTCLLIVGFPPLHNEPLIAGAIEYQQHQKIEGTLIDTNLVIVGNGTLVSLIDPTFLDILDQAINARPRPGVSANEFGVLSTITSPDPYVINSGTKIRTAPTIATSGITSQGKIYRGPAKDGPPADYLFGSTSNFDLGSGFTEMLADPSNLPIAAFRFNSLQLTGNPIIKIPTGGAKKLALVSIGDLTSGPPGGVLTFAGINFLLLATENGSILITDDLAFSNLQLLVFHARGAGSQLVMGSPITGVGTAELDAEGSVEVDAPVNVTSFISQPGGDFLVGSGLIAASDITILAGGNINFATFNFAPSAAMSPNIFLSAGGDVNLDIQNDQSVLTNASGIAIQGTTLNFTDPVGTTLSFNDSTPVTFTAGAGGIQAGETSFLQNTSLMQFISVGDIVVNEISQADTIISTGGSIHTTNGPLLANTITAAGAITSAANVGGSNSVTAGTSISLAGGLFSPSVTAGGNITADLVVVQNINPGVPLPSNTTLTSGSGGIVPFSSVPGVQHTFNVDTVVSPLGIDFSGFQFGMGENGGILTINAQTQQFSAAGIAGVNFSGADAPNISSPAGSGGSLTVNTDGALAVNGVDLSATTGIIDTNGTPSGTGGNISLNSAGGQVSLNNTTVQVSSGDAMGMANRRSSAVGGNINISSGASSGTAILISNTAQLLALIQDASPGPGGLITISATGASSSIQASGTIEADAGSPTAHGIDIRHTGDAGQVTLTNLNASADLIKIAALGNNGTLTVGGGMLSADNTLKLYAPGSNGQIVFVADCTIAGGTATILAANSVTINNSVTVTTIGVPADVYVNSTAGIPNANYTGFGGNNSTSGTFDGAGANSPQPLNAAPPLGAPGVP